MKCVFEDLFIVYISKAWKVCHRNKSYYYFYKDCLQTELWVSYHKDRPQINMKKYRAFTYRKNIFSILIIK